MAIRIDGKKISQEIKDELKAKVAEDKAAGKTACLAVIQVGADPASSIYVRNKKNACAYIGIESLSYELPETTTEEELLTLIRELNQRDDVNGILCQLPVPKHIREDKIIKAAGIIQLLKRSGIEIEGKHCVVVGRSNIVGKPMAILMLRENATVTIAHSRTKNLKEICKEADILIAAIGKPKFFTADYMKEGAVVIDVGIHRQENGKMCGDVDYADVEPHVSAITPVPGGVGPMTIAMLMSNCVESMEASRE